MLKDTVVTIEQQDELEALLKAGKMLSAWKLGSQFGPLGEWQPGRPRHLASWIAGGVGNERLAGALDSLNWRSDRGNPEYYFQALFPRLRRMPPVRLLPEVRQRITDNVGRMEDKVHSDLLAFEAWSYATLRDFDAANSTIAKAVSVKEDHSWIHVQHSSILEMQDRYEEALEVARHALAIRPHYRAAVMQLVECLVHLGRDDEAIELLHHSHEQTEQGCFVLRLQALYSEREDHQKALWCLDEAERLMPLMTESSRKWMAGRRADFLYMAGDLDGCLEWSDRKGEGFQKSVAENLRRPGARERRRVRLDVPFVRQHSMTCAPATIAAIAKFWGRDHDHLEIAEAICYNGTPWHKERIWAESHDFVAREFRFSREILITLIDRGVPFTLTTSAVTSAHLQACIGYDDRLQVALLRDPTHRHFGEILIDGLVADHPIQGPRCMLLVPTSEAGRLDGVILPDEALYDARHGLACALENHDRWKAEEAVSTMRAISPDHAITLQSMGELAGYLGHRSRQLEMIDRLCAQFPEHAPIRLERLHVLQRMGDWAEATALLERMTSRRGCDPAFVSEYGEMLLQDARNLERSGRFLRRAAHIRRSDGHPLESLARWHDKAGQKDEASRLRRYASTLSSTWEPYARGYFDSCRSTGRTEEGLTFLRRRIETLGRMKSDSWLTLARALDSLQRSSEAGGVLEEAISKFPDDGELRVQAGRMMMAWGEDQRSTGLKWIEEARGKVSESYWLRQRALAAVFMGERELAIRLWRQLLVLEPVAIDAHQALARLIAEETGEAEALVFLERATALHPRSPGLWSLLAQWKSGPGASLPALDRLLELDPDDVWARRERATVRFHHGDPAGGLADAREALARDSRDPCSFGVLATLLHQHGEKAEALELIRKALALQIDYTFGIDKLMEWTSGGEAQVAAIRFLADEMERQVSDGSCVHSFQAQAWRVLSPPELLKQLQEFCAARPDLWQTWSARLDQALQMDLPHEAGLCANKLAESFPLLPRTWMEVAKVRHAANDFPGELDAYQQAMALAPAWDLAARKLSETLERLERYDEAEAVLRRAIRHEPLACVNYGLLADLLLKRGKKSEAWDVLEKAVDVGPYYQWGWTTLARLSVDLDRHADFTRRLEARNLSHGHDVQWWIIAVEIHEELGQHEQALEAAHEGLRRTPGHQGLRDQLAQILCQLNRHEEALEVCTPVPGAPEDTRETAGRRAWVLMQSGDGPSAIRSMSELLEREPNYAWGWNVISIWHHSRKDWKRLSDSTRQWTRLCPDDSVAHGYRGLAAENLEDEAQARQSYEKAFLIDPSYQFAGRKLLSHQVKRREFKEARKTLATLRHFSPGPWVECDAVKLSLEEMDSESSLTLAANLAVSVDDPGPIEWMNETLTQKGLGSSWLKRLEECIKTSQNASEALLSGWANQAARLMPLPKAARRLRKFTIPESSRDSAWAPLLQATFSTMNLDLLDSWVGRERKRFKANPSLWNLVGRLYLDVGQPAKAIRWLQGWESRPEDVGSHTVVTLCGAMDMTKGIAAAADIRRDGMSRFPAEFNTNLLRASQAAFLASTERIDEARTLLAPVEDSLLGQYYAGVAALARAVIAAHEQNESESKACYCTALDKLRAWPRDRAVLNYIKDIQQALARVLPWAGGRRRKVVGAWGGLTKERGILDLVWVVLLALFVVIAGLASVATGNPQLLVIIGVIVAISVYNSQKNGQRS